MHAGAGIRPPGITEEDGTMIQDAARGRAIVGDWWSYVNEMQARLGIRITPPTFVRNGKRFCALPQASSGRSIPAGVAPQAL